MRELKYHE